MLNANCCIIHMQLLYLNSCCFILLIIHDSKLGEGVLTLVMDEAHHEIDGISKM